MKRVAIVTGHFPPSNLAGVHRSRIWSQHLAEFGWEPIIVTTHPDYYEEMIDTKLLGLVSPDLRVIHTKAIPTKPVRLIGDIGLRGLYWQFKAVDRMIVRGEIDFLLCTIPSNYTALVGQMIYRRHRFPFGIDYQDPWVNNSVAFERRFSKAWLSSLLARHLEPWAVKNVSLITGVAPLYYDAVLQRNEHLRGRCVTASMPIGNSESDFLLLRENSRDKILFEKGDGLFHMVYAGVMWPKAYDVLDRLLEALALLRDNNPESIDRLRIHFIGTGKSSNDIGGYNIMSRIHHFGVERWVDEHPSRVGYLDVLHHLVDASAILVVGSTEPHYTPSKIYQAVQAKRPIFALLHEESTGVGVLCDSGAGTVVTLGTNRLPEPGELAAKLAAFVTDQNYSSGTVNWSAFEAYSARNSARVLAAAIDEALERLAEVVGPKSFPAEK
jgi:hypothetical protein